jgi:Xaa-Pro aminopeptidase
MTKKALVRIILSMMILLLGINSQNIKAQEAKARWDILNLIQKEKLETILPKAMRENNIDMWIIVNKYGRTDTLAGELGGGRATDKYFQNQYIGYLVLTDRGDEKIERVSLGSNLLEKRKDLKKFVEDRDPKRIAVNMSEYLGIADGLSHTGYLALVEDLGEKYAERLVSSEYLVSDFRSLKVTSEIAIFAKSMELTGQLMERALSNEVITPGVTTLGDIAFWVADQLIIRGYAPSYGSPRIIYPKMPLTKDGQFIVKPPTGPYSRVIQRGDLIGWDMGINILGGFGTDIERYAYVLREGETDVPDSIADAWTHGLKVRKLCHELVRPGRTGLETLHLMYSKVKKLGYEIQYEEDAVSDSPNIEINIGWHSVGEQGHGSGPAVWIDRDQPFCSSLKLKPTHLQAFEFFVYYPLPEWGGNKLRVDFEENVIITENGAELFIPPVEKIHLIR